MKPSPHRSDKELLAWAASIIAREQSRGTFGIVSVHMQDGKIARVKVETTEMPPAQEAPAVRAVG